MSYRLINANLVAESYPEANDMPCIYADLPRGLDGGHYDMRGIDELQAENAKLRMFIDLKETCWKYIGWCDECPYNGVDDEHDSCSCTMHEKINSLARELGVGVEP